MSSRAPSTWPPPTGPTWWPPGGWCASTSATTIRRAPCSAWPSSATQTSSSRSKRSPPSPDLTAGVSASCPSLAGDLAGEDDRRMARAVAPRSIIWASLATVVAVVAVGLAGGTAAAAPTATTGLDLAVSVQNPLTPSLRLTNHTGQTCRVAAQAFGAVTLTRVEQTGVPISPVYIDAGLPDSLDALVLAKLRPLDRGASVDLPLRVVPFGPDGKGHALAALTWSAALGGTEVLYPVQAQGPLRLDVAYAVPRSDNVCGPAVGTSAAGVPGGRATISHRLLWTLLA